MTMQQYCLRWNNHQPNFISVFSSLLNSESLVDVTLAAEGRHLQAHKVVLSACSSYFQSLFTINPCQHPIVILKDVKFTDLKVMVDFMYYGEVNVSQEQLPHILKTAEMLKIKGLADIPVDQSVSKTQNSSSEKTELLTPSETNWSSDVPRQSLSPSPCPLSPTSKRKRLRKSSTGSGSGSAERVDEHQTSEVTLTSSSGSILGTVIKSDPGGYTDGNLLQKVKQHSSDSELHRGSSHESVEGEMSHQVTLQVPQEMSMQHSLDSGTEIAGPSTTSQLTLTGMQWNVMDHTAYAQFASCTSPNTLNPAQTYQCPPTLCPPINPSSPNGQNYQGQITNSPPQIITKRKRSINPQGDENFIRALEAVRFGGIGFCKAARMYGVNNRTLWLEYKKRGYPNQRMSIKNRKQENVNAQTQAVAHQAVEAAAQPPQSPQTEAPSVEKQDQDHPVALISSAFFDGKHVDLGTVLQRPKYLDSQQGVSFQEKCTTTQIQFSQRSQQVVMGTKRGRFLMRQPRIKRESDPNQPSDNEPLSPQYLSVPPVRVERQCSEPLPSHSPPPGANLLTVPGAVLMKQHSHPLLPSQTQSKSVSPPLHIQIVPHSATDSAQRAVSPVVVVTDPLSVSPHDMPLRADSAATAPTTSLRVRSDELKRSASSPQTGTRSSHCPVVRTGPALGCNYCWNTVDTHGRILRRKTKYHCPECQTNLCIVPCFQEYHERHVSAGQTDPIALTTSVMRVFPKTTSM